MAVQDPSSPHQRGRSTATPNPDTDMQPPTRSHSDTSMADIQPQTEQPQTTEDDTNETTITTNPTLVAMFRQWQQPYQQQLVKWEQAQQTKLARLRKKNLDLANARSQDSKRLLETQQTLTNEKAHYSTCVEERNTLATENAKLREEVASLRDLVRFAPRWLGSRNRGEINERDRLNARVSMLEAQPAAGQAAPERPNEQSQQAKTQVVEELEDGEVLEDEPEPTHDQDTIRATKTQSNTGRGTSTDAHPGDLDAYRPWFGDSPRPTTRGPQRLNSPGGQPTSRAGSVHPRGRNPERSRNWYRGRSPDWEGHVSREQHQLPPRPGNSRDDYWNL